MAAAPDQTIQQSISTPVALNLDANPPRVATEFEVVEKAEAFDVTADLQGDDSVRVGVTSDRVIHIVSEKRTEEAPDTNPDTAQQPELEICRLRAVPLPENADETKVVASYKDGELNMNIPKRAETETTETAATVATDAC